MPLFQVTFKKKLNDYELVKCREMYDVKSKAEALQNVCDRYGKDRILDPYIEEIGSDCKASYTESASGKV